jgi:ketosteroid isomerase-like protein
MTPETTPTVIMAASELDQLKDLVRGYFTAVAEGRWDDIVMAMFHEDATLTVPLVPVKHGHARIRPFYVNIGERYAQYRPTVHVVIVEGTVASAIASATVELNAVTHEGRPVSNVAVDKFVIEDGRFRALRIIFDPAPM